MHVAVKQWAIKYEAYSMKSNQKYSTLDNDLQAAQNTDRSIDSFCIIRNIIQKGEHQRFVAVNIVREVLFLRG